MNILCSSVRDQAVRWLHVVWVVLKRYLGTLPYMVLVGVTSCYIVLTHWLIFPIEGVLDDGIFLLRCQPRSAKRLEISGL